MKKSFWLGLATLVCLLIYLTQGEIVQANLSTNMSDRPSSRIAASNEDCRATGWFYVSDRLQICDPNGKVFVPVGTNIMPHYAGEPMLQDEPGPVMSLPALTNLKAWKFNTVRLNLFVNGLGINPNINKIKNYIKTLRSLGMVIMIEAHDYTGKFPDESQINQLIDWHRQISNAAKGDPYVWLNIMNEPGSDNDDSTMKKWRDVHLQIVDAIRKTDPNRMIVVDAPNFGLDDPDTSGFTNSGILKYGKSIKRGDRHLLFSLHTWWGWSSNAESKIKAFLNKTKAANLPLIVGEFGNRVNDQMPPMAAARATVKVAREQQIGRLVWEWFGDDTNYLVKEPEKSASKINSSTKPTNLTELGQLVWNDTHS